MWTQEQFDKLKKWALEGVSYGVIAERLGVSRNAIIGKANRAKLPPRIMNLREAAFKKRLEREHRRVSKATRAQERERERAIIKGPPKTEVTSDIKALIAIPTNNFLSQKRGHCKWPHGPLCAHKAMDMGPYCTEHHHQSRRPG